MGTPTYYYVDPFLAGNVGAGTIGDPYGDLQWALNSIVRDAVNGDQINVKAGTDEILAAGLSLVAYGAPAQDAPLVLRGYTAAANDGGIGGIDNNNAFQLFNLNTHDYVHLIDLHIHNAGANEVVRLRNYCSIVNCEVDTNSGVNYGIMLTTGCTVYNCHVHSVSYGIYASTYCVLYGCFIEQASGYCIQLAQPVIVSHNILTLSGNGTAIQCAGGYGAMMTNNSIYSSVANTGTGINGTGQSPPLIANNIIEGFSGVGGAGIRTIVTLPVYASNAFYNNTAHIDAGVDIVYDDGNNDVTGASPFTNPGGDDFSINGTVAGVTEDGVPQAWLGASTAALPDKGAAQEGAGAGGGLAAPIFGPSGIIRG